MGLTTDLHKETLESRGDIQPCIHEGNYYKTVLSQTFYMYNQSEFSMSKSVSNLNFEFQ